MKKSLFNRLFLLYAILLFMALLISEIFITTTVRESHLDELRQNLSIQVDLISDRINFSRNRIDDVCNEIKKKTGARITVVLADGRVIGDSDTASADMENHSQRTEIAQALLFRTGSTIRRSDTLKTDFLYFAKKITFGRDQIGFIRLAVPLTDIDHAVRPVGAPTAGAGGQAQAIAGKEVDLPAVGIFARHHPQLFAFADRGDGRVITS